MILAGGILYDTGQQERLLEELERNINETRLRRPLDTQLVIRALDELGRRLERGEYADLLRLADLEHGEEQIALAARMLRRDSLEYKVRTELGLDYFSPRITCPPLGFERVTVRPMPLGTLFHIAAGNMDVLPAFSVAEGLLTGNINILKLPQADNGITIEIFLRLIEIEPVLRDYIYVFDTPSTDITAMQKMAAVSDGIVLWGGEEATAAVRRLAPAGCKLIEWGHRLGFAYISGYEDKARELTALAEHIMLTKQLLCSSCQVIYLDTEHMTEVTEFCKTFLPYLDAAAARFPVQDPGAIAEMTLRRYADMLECTLEDAPSAAGGQVFQGKHCSLTACADSELALSYMYGNCLVKRLPERDMMHFLRKAKGTLQTAGLIASPARRERLTELLIRCGVNRVMRAGNMSETFLGEAHDGEYPLRRYTRVVNISE